MAEDEQGRRQLEEAVLSLAREHSTWTVLFHQGVAEQVGLNASDHKCLDLLERLGPMTAGELAEMTGLTTGAITGVIDRLEKAGFARRERDPHDRRKVVVQVEREQALRELGPLFDSLGEATRPLLENFSVQELQVVQRFLEGAVELMEAQAARLRKGGRSRKGRAAETG